MSQARRDSTQGITCLQGGRCRGEENVGKNCWGLSVMPEVQKSRGNLLLRLHLSLQMCHLPSARSPPCRCSRAAGLRTSTFRTERACLSFAETKLELCAQESGGVVFRLPTLQHEIVSLKIKCFSASQEQPRIIRKGICVAAREERAV